MTSSLVAIYDEVEIEVRLEVEATSEAGSEAASECETLSDEQLVSAAKQGQGDAFGELCRRHTKKVLYVTERILRNRADAEDALQDALLSAFVHLKDFDERSRFSTWLTRIAINAGLAKLRKRRRKREDLMNEPVVPGETDLLHELTDHAPNPEEAYWQRERTNAVRKAVGALRPRMRKAVEMRELREHSTEETAKILGISKAAVKARIFHARAALSRMQKLKVVSRSRWGRGALSGMVCEPAEAYCAGHHLLALTIETARQ